MSWIAKDLPTLLMMLIPGFVAAGVFYTLTAHPKTGEFERVIQALIFTVLIRLGIVPARVLFVFLGGELRRRGWPTCGTWTADSELAASLAIALVLGLGFAICANHDWFHRLLRHLRVTKRTSHPSEWYSALECSRLWVVLHIEGGRRLRGWPLEWPDQPDKGHFVVLTPAWLLDDGSEAPLFETEKILVPAKSVEMVEFLKDAEDIVQDRRVIEEVRRRLVSLHHQDAEGAKTDGSESATAASGPAPGDAGNPVSPGPDHRTVRPDHRGPHPAPADRFAPPDPESAAAPAGEVTRPPPAVERCHERRAHEPRPAASPAPDAPAQRGAEGPFRAADDGRATLESAAPAAKEVNCGSG